jgi:hypothetical protein
MIQAKAKLSYSYAYNATSRTLELGMAEHARWGMCMSQSLSFNELTAMYTCFAR